MKRYLVLVLVVLLWSSCSKEEADSQAPASTPSSETTEAEASFYQEEVTPEEVKLVEGQDIEPVNLKALLISTPGKRIATDAHIVVSFREAVVPKYKVGSILSDNPFTFSPDIKGVARWINRREIHFIPDEDLKAGASYSGSISGKLLVGSTQSTDELTFKFSTAEQEVLGFAGDFEAGDQGGNIVRLRGTLSFAQPVDLEKITRDLKCVSRNKSLNLNLELSSDANANSIVVITDDIQRDAEGRTFEFRLPSRYTADDREWKYTAFLSSLDVFKVITRMEGDVSDNGNLSYIFRFSDRIKKDVDLSGFVSVEPDVEFQVRIKRKSLIVEGEFEAGRQYTITLAKGLPSAFEPKLDEDYAASVRFNNLKPSVEWLSEGIYLPPDNNYKLQFKSVNVKALNLKIFRVHSQNLGFFVQKNALQDLEKNDNTRYRSDRYQDKDRVGEVIHTETIEITDQRNQWVNSELDLSELFKDQKNAVFMVDVRFDKNDLVGSPTTSRNNIGEQYLYYESGNYYDDPTRDGFYYSNGNLSKILISTNVGLMLKTSDDGYDITAIDLINATPLKGMELNMVNYQNRILETGRTDGDGVIHFTQKGHYIFGETPEGIAILRVDHTPWNLTSFDVGGRTQRKGGTDVFSYTDRGVHRPGDVIHLSAIIRLKSKSPPASMPVLLKVTNPLGQLVSENRRECGTNGLVDFPIQTNSDDVTGDWQAELTVGAQKFTHTMKVEMVKPVRLKTAIDVAEEIHFPVRYLKAGVDSRYLFGAPAAMLKLKAVAQLRDKKIQIKGYESFTFDNPIVEYRGQDLEIYDGRLDSNGHASINYRLPDLSKVNSALDVFTKTTVYEKGGNFQESRAHTTIYPFEHYAGFKNIFERRSVKKNEEHKIPIAIVDPEGNAVPNQRMRVRVYVNRHYWWWHYDRNNRQDFRERASTYLVSEKTYSSIDGVIEHTMSVEDWGRHYFEVTDLNSGHSSGFFFYASSWGSRGSGEEGSFENHLALNLNREVFQPGDDIEVSFESPEQGMALLSIEQGNQILHREWKLLESSRTSFTVEATEAMLPNVYASVSLIQPHGYTGNDLPLRMFGVIPVKVEQASSHLALELTAPEELKPQESFSVQITSHAEKPASYTIAIVDEGLLSLTNFKTPRPWDHFFEKLGLSVRTTDNLNQIIGALFPDIDKYFSIGGGMDAEMMKKRADDKDSKRFKPVAMFKGPIEIAPGATQELNFDMPNYVGEVRIMVVGTSENSYNHIEEWVKVKQPLMILSTLPRVLRPNDTFTLPVSVFANDSAIKDAQISVKTSSNIKVLGLTEKSVSFKRPGEKDVTFNLKVEQGIGTDTIYVYGVAGDFKAHSVTYMPVTTPNPFITEVDEKTLEGGSKISFTAEKFGLVGSNHARLGITRIPDIQLNRRLNYLIRYPYGCIEQTTSSVFPQLFLPYLLDLDPHREQMISRSINAGIERLAMFKNRGGFSYWPGGSTSSAWGTNYAGHFLIEAKALGYHVPDHLYKHWIKTAKKNARDISKKNLRVAAYRLFLLALAGEANDGGMNLMRENYSKDLDDLSRKLLATAYHLAGQKAIAREVDQATYRFNSVRETGYSYGSSLRDMAFSAYLAIKMEDMNTAAKLVKDVVEKFDQRGWYSTQETAISLLAYGSFYKSNSLDASDVNFSIQYGDADPEKMTLKTSQTILALDEHWGQKVTIESDSKNLLFLTLYTEGIPLDNRIETSFAGINLSRQFYDEKGNPKQVKTVRQGQAFWVVYKVNSRESKTLEEVALTSIIPSGWEIVNLRLTGEQPPQWIANMNLSEGEYMDIRDDRVNWFFDLNGRREQRFGVKINPTFKGEFWLPPVSVETMYSPEYYARIMGEEVQVR